MPPNVLPIDLTALAGIFFGSLMVLIPIAMWLGYGEMLLMAAVVLAPVAAVMVFLTFAKRRWRRSGDGA